MLNINYSEWPLSAAAEEMTADNSEAARLRPISDNRRQGRTHVPDAIGGECESLQAPTVNSLNQSRSIIESVYHFIASLPPWGVAAEMIVSQLPPVLVAVIHLKVEIELINFAHPNARTYRFYFGV